MSKNEKNRQKTSGPTSGAVYGGTDSVLDSCRTTTEGNTHTCSSGE
jgi:hypothetical protein